MGLMRPHHHRLFSVEAGRHSASHPAFTHHISGLLDCINTRTMHGVFRTEARERPAISYTHLCAYYFTMFNGSKLIL